MASIRRTRITSFEVVGDNEPASSHGLPPRSRRGWHSAEAEVETSKGQRGFAEMVAELKLIREGFESMDANLESVATKISVIELRQSNLQGEGTDAVRLLDQWARADTALLSKKAVEVVKSRTQA